MYFDESLVEALKGFRVQPEQRKLVAEVNGILAETLEEVVRSRLREDFEGSVLDLGVSGSTARGTRVEVGSSPSAGDVSFRHRKVGVAGEVRGSVGLHVFGPARQACVAALVEDERRDLRLLDGPQAPLLEAGLLAPRSQSSMRAAAVLPAWWE